MVMTAGTVTIDPETGEPSGGGAARALFDALDEKQDYMGAEGATLAAARQRLADLCNSIGVMITYIKDNAVVSTTIAAGAKAVGVTTGSSDVDVTGTTTGTVS